MNFTNLSTEAGLESNHDNNMWICTLYVCILVLGLANVAVVVGVLKAIRSKRNDNNFCLLNLCVSDLFVSASIPFRISVYVGGRWLCGSIVCSIYLAAQNVCSLASTVFVTLITFDRYVTNVCHPTDTTFAHNFVFSLSATILTWLTSICISIPYVAIFDSFMPMRNDSGSGPHCAYHSFKNLDNLTIFVIAAIRFIVPLTFILAFSIMTVFKLCRLMSSQMGRQGRFYRRYRRVLIVLLVGLVCHISCQSPHYILMLSGYADDKWLLALTFVSSALNPYIYGLANRNIWNSFRGTPQPSIL